ncbi:Ger(x)C family spore germination protein [Paenibacillus soyae]|uniref:Ger(X)C family spore germination protein n=1 Tax=Paenibacillus soyae TaxID=2969249 RepID=A0A9X2MQ61_9BACL|nr:Ger(x)C family spore germination protein [Paenibacillus soyae]MCR2803761.1 Ger(x)C family spore germination protein [Paenibacillus soyae]
MKRARNKAIAAVLVCLLIMLLLGGCWDNKDINHRSLPIVMGIAKRESQYLVVLQIPEPGLGATKIRLVEETGTTISEIVDRISKNMESQIDLLHLKVVLFEKGYAEEGVNDSVETFMRAHSLSPKTMTAICDEPINLFFRNIDSFNKNNGTILINFFEKNAGWNPHISADRVWELFRSIHSYTRDTVIPIVRSGTGTVIESNGSGVIRGGKLVERLTSDQTLLINMFNGISAKGKIEVMDHATVEILSSSIRRRGSIEDGHPVVKGRISLKVSLIETRGQPSQQQIKKEVEALLSDRFDAMLKKLKAHQADVLGAGQLFRTQYSRDQLERWRTDYFPSLNVDIKFDTVIQNTGKLKADA